MWYDTHRRHSHGEIPGQDVCCECGAGGVILWCKVVLCNVIGVV